MEPVIYFNRAFRPNEATGRSALAPCTTARMFRGHSRYKTDDGRQITSLVLIAMSGD
jgi:hypothetical protein